MKNRYEVRGEVTKIILRWKKDVIIEALVDTTDLSKILEFPNTWFAKWDVKLRNYYVYGFISESGNRRTIWLHRYVMNAPIGMFVDHINHNTLDNRRENLRILSNAENQQNRRAISLKNRSGYRGVNFDKTRKKWRARVRINGETVFLAYFDDVHKAGQAVMEARAKLMPYSNEAC